jgi:acyl transferase domain-containing protein/acyl carrier protein
MFANDIAYRPDSDQPSFSRESSRLKPDTPTAPPVAIIGMGCFFPKAAGPREFWRLLSRGQDAIDEVPDTHWRASDYYDPDPKTPDHVYCTRGGYLSPIDFDPTEFGIPPMTLEATDTSQLLGLVAAKAALADAGYDDSRPWDRSRTGVILGVTGTQELVIPLGARLGHPIWRRALKEAGVPADRAEEVVRRIADGYVPWQEASFPGLLGNVVAGRISNRLDLGGTNCAVDAACASSMSAMHLALMELYAGRSDMVVTGGVDTLNDIFMHMCFTATPILSPTGDVRPFSKDADGSLLGEGVGIVILKRLDAAERDGDRVYAVIRALGSGSDGRSNSIYAPHVEGQKKAILAAYEAAGVPTDSVGLVEAHGTGTRVGDRVEFTALKQVFGEGTSRRIAVGSVKSMIGHTKAAAGAAGLIKTALCLYHKVLPPSLKVGEPDPGLELETGPLYLNTATRPWISADGAPRRAGVSSFGFGGSNFHMVLEEYEPEKSSVSWDGSVEIFALSGADRTAVALELDDLRKTLKQADAGAVARIAARSRNAFSPEAPCRLLVVLEKTLDRFADPETALRAAADRLSGARPGPDGAGGVFLGEGDAPGPIGFLYPGQGSQYVGMGRDLVCRFPEALDALARAGSEVADAVFPEPALTPESAEAQAEALRRTDRAQPAIGAISLAMTRILEYFGIRPGAAAGHSFGELCALFAAGWIDAPTLLRLALARGRLMAEAGGPEAGSMLAVAAPLDEVARWIEEQGLDLVLANRNGPEQGVLSGPSEAIDRAETLLKAKGRRVRRLPVSAAFHSRLMAEARKPFAEILAEAEIAPTETPVYSNATGEAYPRNAAEVRRLLAEQLVSPVEFVKEIAALFQAGVRTFVEIGPKTVLGGLVRAILKGEPVRVLAVDGSGGKGFGMTDLARLLCGLAALGYPVRLDRWERPEPEGRSPRMRIPLTGANYRSPRKEAGKRTSAPPPGGSASGGSAPEPPGKKTPPAVAHPVGASAGKPAVGKASKSAAETAIRVHASMDASRAAGGNGGNRPGKSAGESVSEIAETPKTAPTGAPPSRCRESAAAPGMEARAVRFPPPPAEIPATFDRIGSTAAPKPTNPPAAAPGPAAGRTASPRDAGPSISSAPAEDSSLRQPPNRDDQRHPAASVQPSVESHMTRNQNPPTETEPGRRSADLVADAFEAVREGLRAMQSLQARTAETHSKFLETQAEANRTLQAMMLRTQRLAEAGLGLPPDGTDSPMTVARRPETEAPADPISPPVPELPPEIAFEPIPPAPATRSVDPPMPEASPVPAEPASLRSVQSDRSESGGGPARDELAAALVAVVSEQTGYPEEMLSLEMEIEADLGIDSIKRVEILGAFEEKMPGLPPVSPEIMGTLRTLDQILDHLLAAAGPGTPGRRENAAGESAAPRSSEPLPAENRARTVPESAAAGPSRNESHSLPAPERREASPASGSFAAEPAGASTMASSDLAVPPGSDAGARDRIAATLVAVVSEQTGYPEEMLSLEMEIEADLGIDSIKRVEILGAFEERMPELPPVSPEIMGTLKDAGSDRGPSVLGHGTGPIRGARRDSGDRIRGSRSRGFPGHGGFGFRDSDGVRRRDPGSHRRGPGGRGERADRLSRGNAVPGDGDRGRSGHRFHQAGGDSRRLRGEDAGSSAGFPGDHGNPQDAGSDRGPSLRGRFRAWRRRDGGAGRTGPVRTVGIVSRRRSRPSAAGGAKKKKWSRADPGGMNPGRP